MRKEFDVLVIGSGASAVHAAHPLVEAGFSVGMIDPGYHDKTYRSRIPDDDFLSIRQADADQHRYFLGDEFEGIPFGPVRVGAQLTPPRQFITRNDGIDARVEAGVLQATQSFARGGLGAGWGASTMPYTNEDLYDWPIDRADLQPHYNAVAERIGVCGPKKDDLSRHVGEIDPLMPPPRLDSNADWIYRRYERVRGNLLSSGFRMGEARLAICTRPHHGRGPLNYGDMEFWADQRRSVYRPAFTIDELKTRANFHELSGLFARLWSENESSVTVQSMDVQTNEKTSFTAKQLVVAAGAIGSARLALQSLGRVNEPVPFLTNPYTYLPSLALARIGKTTRNRRHSLTQLTMIYDPDGTGRNVIQPQLYSYRSLLLFKLLKESPLPVRESIPLLRTIQEYFVIVGIFHPDRPSNDQCLFLSEDGTVTLRSGKQMNEARNTHEKRIGRLLRKVGCVPLKRIDPGPGASIHYAGTLPMHQQPSLTGPLTCDIKGRLRGARRIVIADGSTFPTLPAKGLTFTLMANANRIGTALVRELKS